MDAHNLSRLGHSIQIYDLRKLFSIYPQKLWISISEFWSRRQESNLYPTLRRHVHYPLCYGENKNMVKPFLKDVMAQNIIH